MRETSGLHLRWVYLLLKHFQIALRYSFRQFFFIMFKRRVVVLS